MCLLGSIVDLVMSSMKPHYVLSDLWRNSGKEDIEDRKKTRRCGRRTDLRNNEIINCYPESFVRMRWASVGS